MKTFVRILSLTLVAVMLCVTLASCGGPSGKFYAGDTQITKTYTTYEFKGSKVVFESYLAGKKVESACFEGKFKVKGDEITFTVEDAEGEAKSETLAYEKLEDGSIKIGLVTLKPMD